MKIPISRPFFGEEEFAKIQEPLLSGWVVQGPLVREFENKFSTFVGAENSIATSSGTSALHVAVAALGLKSGDEVIVPSFTWVATANVVEHMGAKAVFCDIELESFNIDVTKIESFITERTVGIIPVHLFGLSAEMDPIMEIANKNDLWVVEDAACGLGSTYNGSHVGLFGNAGCFSFHPRKSITTGEGGMIITNSQDIAMKSRSLRNHGEESTSERKEAKSNSFLLSDFNRLGFNYRMTDIQGALGSVQMDRLEGILQSRQKIANKYDEALRDLDWLQIPSKPSDGIHSYQSYVCLYKAEQAKESNIDELFNERNNLMARLDEKGIASRPGTHAVVLQSYYRQKYDFGEWQFPNALIAERLSFALPLFAQMTEEEQDYVIDFLISWSK